jgi:hypothetical protein
MMPMDPIEAQPNELPRSREILLSGPSIIIIISNQPPHIENHDETHTTVLLL